MARKPTRKPLTDEATPANPDPATRYPEETSTTSLPRPAETITPNSISGHLARIITRAAESIPMGPELPTPLEDMPCPICQGRGYVYADPEGTSIKLCACKIAAWAAGQPARLLKYWQHTSGVPEDFQDLRLDDHPNLTGPAANPGLLEHLKAADKRTESWLFWGAAALGKSGVAVGYAWDFLQETAGTLRFRVVPSLMTDLKATFDRHAGRPHHAEGYGYGAEPQDDDGPTTTELLRDLETVGLLVLDDLGAEHITDWTKEQIFAIVNARKGGKLPTVFTSNLSLRDLEKAYGPRISSRILEVCGRGENVVTENVVHIQGRDLRRK